MDRSFHSFQDKKKFSKMKLFLSLIAFLAVASVSSAQQLVAEGYFVVDDAAVQRYISESPGSSRAQAEGRVRADLDYFLTEANQMLRSLAPTVDVQIAVRAVDVLDNDIFQSSDFASPNELNPTLGFSRFSAWLLSQNAPELLNYDFSILYTGYNIDGITYISPLGTICDNTTAVGLVKATTTYEQTLDTAITVARILGAPQDGRTSEYLGATTLGPSSQNRWSFSDCSANWIRAQIDSLSDNCLLEADPSSSLPATTPASYTGSLLDPDTACERFMNDSRSHICVGHQFYNDAPPNGDVVCRVIYCQIPGVSRCRSFFPSDGMVCNPGMRCNDGQCQADASAPSGAPADCLWGDQEELVFPSVPFVGSCQQLVDLIGRDACYAPLIRERCCGTCIPGSIPGCEFGDRNSACTGFTRDVVCPGNRATCCEHCLGFVAKRSIRPFEERSVHIAIHRFDEYEFVETMDNSTEKPPPLIGY